MNRKEILRRCKSYIRHENLLRLDYIFESDRDTVAKQFIKDTMDLDHEKMSFEDIKTNVCNIVSHMKIKFPDEEIDFYNTVFKRLMFLRSLPKDEYEILNKKTIDLYAKIDRIQSLIEDRQIKIKEEENIYENKLKSLKNKIKELRSNCKPYKEELQQKEIISVEIFPKLSYELRRCEHYKRLIKDELKQIQSINLKDKALECSSIPSDSKYKYYISSLEDSEDLFLPDCDYSISVKFAKELNEFISRFENKPFDAEKYNEECAKYPYHSNLIEDLRSNSIEEYNTFLLNCINEKNVCEYILDNIKNNHVLNKRFELLESAVECFNKKQYLSFINITTTQIEGIFYDFCFEMDIQPERLDSFTLGTKVKLLNDKQLFNAYEYFAFDFPLVRNKVAHGLTTERTEKIQLEKTTYETLLDLQYLVYIFQTNNKFPYFKPINFVKTYLNSDKSIYSLQSSHNKASPKNECLYFHFKSSSYRLTPSEPINKLQWILNPMYNEVYNFYNYTNEHEEIRNRLLSCDFLQFISDKMNNQFAPIGLKSHDAEIVEQLKVWIQLFNIMDCYCKDNDINIEVITKIAMLKTSAANIIRTINRTDYDI